MISVSLFRLGIIGAREIAIFFKNGSGGFDLSQNRRMAMCSAFWPQKTSCHNCGFFYSRRAALLFSTYTISVLLTNKPNISPATLSAFSIHLQSDNKCHNQQSNAPYDREKFAVARISV